MGTTVEPLPSPGTLFSGQVRSHAPRSTTLAQHHGDPPTERVAAVRCHGARLRTLAHQACCRAALERGPEGAAPYAADFVLKKNVPQAINDETFRRETGHKSENFREKQRKKLLRFQKRALRRGSTAPPSVNEPSPHSPRRSSRLRT
jgi:hypothetical protein